MAKKAPGKRVRKRSRPAPSRKKSSTKKKLASARNTTQEPRDKRNGPKVGADDVKGSFFDLGVQYYAAARFGAAASLNPVSANLSHHAIECFLKGYLAGRGWTLDSLKKGLHHDLRKAWREFKKEASSTGLSRYDGTIRALYKYEHIRYPDAILQRGFQSAISFAKPKLPVGDPQRKEPVYELVIEDIDYLVLLLFRQSSRNARAFHLSDVGRAYLVRDNSTGLF